MILSYILMGNIQLIWTNIFFYLFLVSLIMASIIILISVRKITQKNKELKEIQSQHSAKIDILRKEHTEKFDELRNEMLKKEEERTRQWMESEKETLTVLNGVSHILELSDNIAKVESEKVITKLDEIKDLIEKNCDNHEKNRKT